MSFLGNTAYQLIPRYFDPKGIGDFYRFVISINTKKDNEIFVFSDELSDGSINSRPIFIGGNDSDSEIKKGDIIALEMQCVDKGVYDYFNSLSEYSDDNSATPANPISNITGGALGYFAAYTQQIRSVVVQ